MSETMPILYVPAPMLRARARLVEATDDVRALSEKMLATMYAAPGIGLAAPQVGEALRLVVLDVSAKDAPPNPVILLNPEVVAVSEDLATREEGCLSLPGMYADVTRPHVVRVRYQGLDGSKQEIEGEGLLSACLQHEIDHLNGVLFIDYLSPLKRNMILRKLAKELKRERDQ